MVAVKTPKVLIIGGGIIGTFKKTIFILKQKCTIHIHDTLGVSTALELQRQCPGVEVTILTDQVSPHTTGDGAAGLFSLFLLGDTPLDKQVQSRLWQ